MVRAFSGSISSRLALSTYGSAVTGFVLVGFRLRLGSILSLPFRLYGPVGGVQHLADLETSFCIRSNRVSVPSTCTLGFTLNSGRLFSNLPLPLRPRAFRVCLPVISSGQNFWLLHQCPPPCLTFLGSALHKPCPSPACSGPVLLLPLTHQLFDSPVFSGFGLSA